MDDLLRRADGAKTPAAAEGLYNDAQKRVIEDFPVIPLFYGTYVSASTDRVSGVTLGPADIDLTRISVTG